MGVGGSGVLALIAARGGLTCVVSAGARIAHRGVSYPDKAARRPTPRPLPAAVQSDHRSVSPEGRSPGKDRLVWAAAHRVSAERKRRSLRVPTTPRVSRRSSTTNY